MKKGYCKCISFVLLLINILNFSCLSCYFETAWLILNTIIYKYNYISAMCRCTATILSDCRLTIFYLRYLATSIIILLRCYMYLTIQRYKGFFNCFLFVCINQFTCIQVQLSNKGIKRVNCRSRVQICLGLLFISTALNFESHTVHPNVHVFCLFNINSI